MYRHQGTLPPAYISKLSSMSLQDVAEEAAKLRSDGKRCGTATALILRWTIRHKVAPDPAAVTLFFNLYRAAWDAEKQARAANTSVRPASRPVVGGNGRYRGVRNQHVQPVLT